MAKDNFYSKKVLKLFKDQKHFGKIKNAQGIGKVGNPMCGDVMKIYLKISKNKKGKEYIEKIRIETFGCVAAIATSEITAKLFEKKEINKVLKELNYKKILKEVGGLPPFKIHCSLLAVDALSEALYNYFKKSKKKIPKILVKKHKRIIQIDKNIKEKFL